MFTQEQKNFISKPEKIHIFLSNSFRNIQFRLLTLKRKKDRNNIKIEIELRSKKL